jgi:hypothetical protein
MKASAIRALISAGLVILFGLMGLSLSRVEPSMADRALELTAGGAFIAIVALAIGALLRPRNLETDIPSRWLLGLKIGTFGFLIALAGWLLGVFISVGVGYWVAVAGILLGGAGMLVCFLMMLSGDGKAT